MKKKFPPIALCFTLIFMAILIWGCAPKIQADKPYLEIRDGWARTKASETSVDSTDADAWKKPVGPLSLGPNGLIFMTVENKGGAGDKLMKVSSDVAEKVELQHMVLSGQKTSSYAAASLDLPAHSVTKLESGGFYIRLVGIKENLPNGSKFDLTLEFEQSGSRTVQIVIANPQ
jgi:copper(I)-binding protein